MVLAEKPNISDDTFSLDPSVLDELISHLSTLAAIYHKPPSTFISGKRLAPVVGGAADRDDEEEDGSQMTSDMMGEGLGGAQGDAPAPPPPAQVDLLGGLMDDEPPAPTPPPAAMGGGMGGMGGLDDIFGGGMGGGAAAPATPDLKVTLPADRGEGMQVRSAFVKQNGVAGMQVCIENNTMGPLSGFAIQFNKNSFGLQPDSPAALGACLPPQIAPGQNATGFMPLTTAGQLQDSKGVVQMAIKTNVKVFYFQDAADVLLFFQADGKLDQKVFLEQWRSQLQEHRVEASGIPPQSEVVETICPKLEASAVFFIARRKLPEADMVYLSIKMANGIVMLAEVGFRPGTGAASIVVKSAQPQYLPLFAASIEKLLKQ